ncbi:hypothetical protein M0R45_027085 [Rubus argutus]|uniref:Uncharacterized protein n=1 Tax=Rubus argutus TaxID=59490 RepID=A0AAW1X131_RUBAR
MFPSLFLMEVTVSCSGLKLQLEPNRKLQPNHSQNLSFSRRVHKLSGVFSREDGNHINAYEPFTEFSLLDAESKLHQGITDLGPES